MRGRFEFCRVLPLAVQLRTRKPPQLVAGRRALRAPRRTRRAQKDRASAATQRSAAALCACIGASPGAMDAAAGQPAAEDASRREALHALLRRDLIDPFKVVGSDIGPQSLAVLVCTAAQCGMDDEAGELAATAGGMTKQEDFFRALPGWAQAGYETATAPRWKTQEDAACSGSSTAHVADSSSIDTSSADTGTNDSSSSASAETSSASADTSSIHSGVGGTLSSSSSSSADIDISAVEAAPAAPSETLHHAAPCTTECPADDTPLSDASPDELDTSDAATATGSANSTRKRTAATETGLSGDSPTTATPIHGMVEKTKKQKLVASSATRVALRIKPARSPSHLASRAKPAVLPARVSVRDAFPQHYRSHVFASEGETDDDADSEPAEPFLEAVYSSDEDDAGEAAHTELPMKRRFSKTNVGLDSAGGGGHCTEDAQPHSKRLHSSKIPAQTSMLLRASHAILSKASASRASRALSVKLPQTLLVAEDASAVSDLQLGGGTLRIGSPQFDDSATMERTELGRSYLATQSHRHRQTQQKQKQKQQRQRQQQHTSLGPEATDVTDAFFQMELCACAT